MGTAGKEFFMKSNGKLSVLTKMKYGVGDFGLAIVTAMLQFSMLFYYTDFRRNMY